MTTSFGAVLDFGNGTYALVDANGDPIGPSVTVTLAGDEPLVQLVASGDFLAVLVNEETFDPMSVAPMQTIIGCVP